MANERQLRQIDDAITQRAEHDKRITAEYLESFRRMDVLAKKTAFLLLDDRQQHELLGFFSTDELQELKTEVGR